MTTALALLAEELKLTDTEFKMAKAMLSESPVAATGQETLVPLEILAQQIEIDPSERTEPGFEVTLLNGVGAFLMMLTHQKTVQSADLTVASRLSVLQSFALIDESKFVRFRMSEGFLSIFASIAKSQQLEQF